MGPGQWKVLVHVANTDTTTIGETAHVTGLTVSEARAMLRALARQGYVYERLGHEGFEGDREVPRGRYIITGKGSAYARWYEGEDEWWEKLPS